MATLLPEVNSAPLYNCPHEQQDYDKQHLWEAVQKLQADLNQLLQYLKEQETPP